MYGNTHFCYSFVRLCFTDEESSRWPWYLWLDKMFSVSTSLMCIYISGYNKLIFVHI